MLHLLDLPNETLGEIIWHTHVRDEPKLDVTDKSALLSLCLTCHKLRALAEPFLYHTFRIPRNFFQPVRCFLSFSTTIARRPDLRKEVKCLDLYLDHPYERPGGKTVSIPEDFVQSKGFRDLAQNAQFVRNAPDAELWEPRTVMMMYPHVMALVSMLPNLKVLRIKAKHVELQFHRIAELGETNLVGLQELVLVPPKKSTGTVTGAEQILPLFSLPRLNKLSIKNFDLVRAFERPNGVEPTYLAPDSLNVRRVYIRECSMQNKFMCSLIRAVRRLTHFVLRVWEEPKEHRLEEVDVENWHAALSLHKESLEELSLDCLNEFRLIFEYHNDPLPMWPSFRSFSSLKALRMDYRRMAYERLPPNLTSLHLFDCRDCKDDTEIDGWCAVKKDYCPHLEYFEIVNTKNCIAVEERLANYGFNQSLWIGVSRLWWKDGFELKVSFTELLTSPPYSPTSPQYEAYSPPWSPGESYSPRSPTWGDSPTPDYPPPDYEGYITRGDNE